MASTHIHFILVYTFCQDQSGAPCHPKLFATSMEMPPSGSWNPTGAYMVLAVLDPCSEVCRHRKPHWMYAHKVTLQENRELMLFINLFKRKQAMGSFTVRERSSTFGSVPLALQAVLPKPRVLDPRCSMLTRRFSDVHIILSTLIQSLSETRSMHAVLSRQLHPYLCSVKDLCDVCKYHIANHHHIPSIRSLRFPSDIQQGKFSY